MRVPQARKTFATAALFFACVVTGSPVFAQVRTNTPGTVFEPDRSPGVAVENIGAARRFRGPAHQEITLRGTLQMPNPGAAEPKLLRLVVHFRTSPGPRLRGVELRNGLTSLFRLETDLSGDYSTRDILKPDTAANAWVLSAITVAAPPVVRLTVQFSGGVDSVVDPGEFVLLGVGAEFVRKLPSATEIDRGPGRLPPTVPRAPVPAPPAAAHPVAASQVIYALNENNDLLWFGHTGQENGTFAWAATQPLVVATRWGFKQVFSGGDGIIYAITTSGDLLWYRHEGSANGSVRWGEPKKVGSGWNFPRVFSGGGGVIYAVTAKGELWWFRHEGHEDGTARWANDTLGGQMMIDGWGSYKHVFYGGQGVIYAVTSDDRLLWYRHEGHDDGTFRWTSEEGRQIGTGWGFKILFSAGDGVIYGLNAQNELLWYRHEGRENGTARWAAPTGKIVGTGWNFKNIFSGF